MKLTFRIQTEARGLHAERGFLLAWLQLQKTVSRLAAKRHWLKRTSADEGATMVEMAISCAVLFAMFFGIFQMCFALYSYHYVAEIAREASRYAIVRGSESCTYTPNLTNCNATSTQIQTYMRDRAFPGINSRNLNVTTTWPTTGSACTPSVSPCNNPGNQVKVKVVYTFPLAIPFWKSGQLSVGSTSTMVISQ